MEQISSGDQLRAAISHGAIQVPGAANALIAKQISQTGFAATYLSGAAFSTATLGLPDIGLFTLTELAEQTRRIANACDLPLIVDADTGFGDVLNVERTVLELESAGAAAIQLEDQHFPKRCGHLAGKTLISEDEMSAKVQAASLTKKHAATVIIARTDARAVEGFDAAVSRAQAYVEAGADWVFPEALESSEEFAQFAKQIDVPLVANMTEFGKSPLLDFSELDDLGYSVVLYPVTLLRAAMKATEAVLHHLLVDGNQRELLDLMQTRGELYELIGYDPQQPDGRRRRDPT